MFNFRELIPWPRATDWQQVSTDIYSLHRQQQKEKEIAVGHPTEVSYSVGPSTSYDDGAILNFRHGNGTMTTIEMNLKSVQTLISLLETVIEQSGEQDE
jgi:hypothetical protein